jgi:hypothetical protein
MSRWLSSADASPTDQELAGLIQQGFDLIGHGIWTNVREEALRKVEIDDAEKCLRGADSFRVLELSGAQSDIIVFVVVLLANVDN